MESFNLTRDGRPVELPANPKPIHHLSLAECQKGATEYFKDPVRFKRRGNRFYCCDASTLRILGQGHSYGEAVVDAIAREQRHQAEIQKDVDAKMAAEKAKYEKEHPIRHKVKSLLHRLKGDQ